MEGRGSRPGGWPAWCCLRVHSPPGLNIWKVEANSGVVDGVGVAGTMCYKTGRPAPHRGPAPHLWPPDPTGLDRAVLLLGAPASGTLRALARARWVRSAARGSSRVPPGGSPTDANTAESRRARGLSRFSLRWGRTVSRACSLPPCRGPVRVNPSFAKPAEARSVPRGLSRPTVRWANATPGVPAPPGVPDKFPIL